MPFYSARRLLFVSAIVVVFLPLALTATGHLAGQSENYRLTWLHIASGGVHMTSAAYQLEISASPPSAAPAQSENFAMLPVLARPEDTSPGFNLIRVPGDEPTIQAGLLAASWGDTVEVACGTYHEYDIALVSGVTLRAESVGCVTADPLGQGRGFDCGDVLQATLSGFTITGGQTATSGGGAVFSNCQVTLSDCRFVANAADNSGAGLYGVNSTLEVIRCRFEQNQAAHGGAMLLTDSFPALTDCIFSGNSATSFGGAVRLRSSSPSFQSCTFAGNSAGSSGAALHCSEDSNPILSGCTLWGNTNPSSGVVRVASGSYIVLENTIIAGSPSGSAVSCYDASVLLQCCDVWGNAGGDWTGCIADQAGTSGNLSVDPLFCDAGAGDFTLWGDSPCAAGANPGCGLIGAWSVTCALVPDQDIIGMYADAAGTVAHLQVETGTVFTLYLVARHLQDQTGITAWECALPVPDDLTLMQTTIHNLGSNEAVPPEYRVTLGEPLPWTETIVLAELSFITVSTAPQEFYITATDPSFVVPPAPNSLSDDPFLRTTLTPSSGSMDLPVFRLNDPLSGQPDPALPAVYDLKRCYPNPFNPQVNIRFELPSANWTTIRIFDVKGRLVRGLLEAERPAGHHCLTWDGRNQSGSGVASGIYLVRMQAGRFVAQQKITLVR